MPSTVESKIANAFNSVFVSGVGRGLVLSEIYGQHSIMSRPAPALGLPAAFPCDLKPFTRAHSSPSPHCLGRLVLGRRGNLHREG